MTIGSGSSACSPAGGVLQRMRGVQRIDVVFLFVGLLWVCLLSLSLVVSWHQLRKTSLALAVEQAQAGFEKDILYRRWATMHGGVYVPISEHTPPNPYLAVPLRDVETVQGQRLTLVNPAYMTRQVHELGRETSGVVGHITSLNPIRPENAADDWETRALQAFAAGATKISSLEEVNGEPMVRFMRPMITEKGCLKCHAQQGYREGDIRGGISVTVPFAPYLAIEQQSKRTTAVSHALIGLSGLLALFLFRSVLLRSQKSLRDSEQRLEQLINGLGEGVILQDDTGRIVLWNRTAAEVFHLQSDEIVGMSPTERNWNTIHEDGSDFQVTDHPSLHTLRTGVSLSGVVMGVRRDREETVWIRINTRPLYDRPGDKPSAVIISFADITEIRQAEERLQQSEVKFRTLFENMTAGFALHEMIYDDDGRPRDYRYLEVNPAFERLTGIRAADVVGRTVKEVLPATESYWVETYGQVARSGEPQAYQNYSQEIDRYFDVWVFSPAKDRFAVVFTDMTERVVALRALRESEENLRSLFNAIHESVFLFDRNGIIIAANETFAKRVGKRVPECLGTSIYSLVADEVASHRKAVVEELIRTGRPARFEDVRNGRYFHHSLYPILDADGAVLRVAVYAMDISERRRSEEELRLSEKRYRYLFDNVQDVVYTTTFDGTIIDITPSIKELSKGQYAREDVIGRTWADFYEYPEERQHVLDALQKDGFINDYRIVLKNRDGSTAVCSISARLQYDDAGNPDRIVGNIRDVTDRVDLEKQLLQAQKMESVGRLAGGVAHDFNNMLGVIIGYTDLILEQVDEHQPIYPALKEIEQAALRSADLTGQLLAFARKQTVTPKVLDLHETVVGMLTMLRRLIGEQIKLVWMPCRDSLLVKMDPSQIDQILANLCVNARDAIRGNGTVTIETRSEELDITDTAGRPDAIPGPFACLAVTDDGCGIDPDDLPHLFEPFYTTKEVGSGTGLGLATVYGIVSQNGGFLEVDSQLGRGTTIEVYLPRVSELVAEQSPSHGEVTAVQKGEETILLVEDEQMILEMTTRMLRHEGYRIIAVASPEEAVRIAAEHPQAIHLLITDVIMPSMNGKELARRLHTVHPDLRCLFMSGYTADIIAQHGVLDTGISFIQKPFSRTELLTKVREVLDQAELG